MKQTVTTEIDIPEGWEFVRCGSVSKGDFYLAIDGGPQQATTNYENGCIIIRRVKKYRTPTLPADLWKECEFSNNKDFNPVSCVSYVRGYVVSNTGDLFPWVPAKSCCCFQYCRIEIKDNE